MLKNALTLIAGAVLLVLGFMFSLVALAMVVIIGLVVWGHLWWKTWKLRQASRGQAMQDTSSDGHIVEGESFVVEEIHSSTAMLPPKPSRPNL